ncbi:MAG: hypothetical protein ACTSVL_11680 [Promethearchaeota archaeon]
MDSSEKSNSKSNTISNSSKDPKTTLDSNFRKIDPLFSLLSKIYFYLGLFVCIPYLILSSKSNYIPNLGGFSPHVLWIFLAGAFLVLFAMDNIAMVTSFIDRISRLLVLIFTIIGAISSGILFWLIYTNNTLIDNLVNMMSLLLLSSFCYLGWFFIRAERGLTTYHHKPKFLISMVILFGCSLLYFFELIWKGAIFIGFAGSFLTFPLLIFILGKAKVSPEIKPRQLINPYKRTTFYNYVIDVIKAAFTLVTLFVILFDGKVVLFPAEISSNPAIWIRNFAFIGIFAGIAMFLYNHFHNKFHGLIPYIIVFSVCIVMYLIVNAFHLELWWIVAPLNGLIIATVFYYLEEKAYNSDNIRAMPGTFYILILIIFSAGILFRETEDVNVFMENMKIWLSMLGLGYIIGYVREAPKQKSQIVRI